MNAKWMTLVEITKSAPTRLDRTLARVKTDSLEAQTEVAQVSCKFDVEVRTFMLEQNGPNECFYILFFGDFYFLMFRLSILAHTHKNTLEAYF